MRLLTINAVNGYLTSWTLYLIGGAEDPRLLLPAWIGISTVRCSGLMSILASLWAPRAETDQTSHHRLLPLMYHGTQRKINIRKETSMSISVFSIASYISMVALLIQLYLSRSDYPVIPLASFAQRGQHKAEKLTAKLVEYGHATTSAAKEL